jgi:hypothetical protein
LPQPAATLIGAIVITRIGPSRLTEIGIVFADTGVVITGSVFV